jgi:hypothetical protein
MSFTAFYSQIENAVRKNFARTASRWSEFDLAYVISPHRLKIPKIIAEKAQAAIRAHYQLIQNKNVQVEVSATYPWLQKLPPQTDALLMAYDFHTTADGNASLIEVNTNASAYMLSLLLYRAHGIEPKFSGRSAEDSLLNAFKQTSFASGSSSPHIAIVDENIDQQKMLIEFLMYQDWLEKHGFTTELVESNDLKIETQNTPFLCGPANQKIDLVYNRLTDFYLESPTQSVLRQAYTENLSIVSPHPWAYLLLADKARLIELSNNDWLNSQSISDEQKKALREVIIPTRSKAEIGTAEDLWAQRKNLFFKPRQSHGAKSVYRGSSVSRKVFERLMQEDIVVQNYVPAQDYPVDLDNAYLENWKFDLRFFVYRDQIQMAVARLYQGQVTNFSSRFGGLTAVEFID